MVDMNVVAAEAAKFGAETAGKVTGLRLKA